MAGDDRPVCCCCGAVAHSPHFCHHRMSQASWDCCEPTAAPLAPPPAYDYQDIRRPDDPRTRSPTQPPLNDRKWSPLSHLCAAIN